MKTKHAKFITINALAIALVCVSTMLIQIPIPLGYMHLGNSCILLISTFFGPITGLLAGGIGSALADLLSGYSQWVLPTFIIKSFMGFAIGYLASGKKNQFTVLSLRTLLACIAGVLTMVLGYFLAGTILYGGAAAGAAQIPGLSIEGILGMLLFYAAGIAFEKAHIRRFIYSEEGR